MIPKVSAAIMLNVIYLLSKFGKIYLAEGKLLKPTFYSPPMSLIHLSSATDSCITHSAKLPFFQKTAIL